ncbi:uncharacterized protein [Dysidea avara]|uniref:uncharacterized protein n=1 Tax=Dysidea avara TaxID=196820 RepID=UPI00331B5B49
MEASSEREKDREKRKRKQNDGEEQNVIKKSKMSPIKAAHISTNDEVLVMEASSEREKDREKRKRKQNEGKEQNVIKKSKMSPIKAAHISTNDEVLVMEASSEREKDREKRKRKQNEGKEQIEIKILLMQILSRLKRIEKFVMPTRDSSSTPCVADNVGGINVALLPAKDSYAYALILLDALFTKEELSRSLMFKTPKSSKPPLDEKRIQRLIFLVEKRFPGQIDMKTLKLKVNQKCRDSGVVKVKKEAVKEEEKAATEDTDEVEATNLMEGSSSGATRSNTIPLFKPFVDGDTSEESDDDDS